MLKKALCPLNYFSPLGFLSTQCAATRPPKSAPCSLSNGLIAHTACEAKITLQDAAFLSMRPHHLWRAGRQEHLAHPPSPIPFPFRPQRGRQRAAPAPASLGPAGRLPHPAGREHQVERAPAAQRYAKAQAAARLRCLAAQGCALTSPPLRRRNQKKKNTAPAMAAWKRRDRSLAQEEQALQVRRQALLAQ